MRDLGVWIVVVGLAAGACGNKTADGSAAASGSTSGSASAAGSAPAPAPRPPPPPPPDAALPPAARAKAALDTAASVVQAFTAAIGSDRCGAADRIHAAAVANADKIAQVKAAFAEHAVAVEAAKLPPDIEPIASAVDAWQKTMIDGNCKVTEDQEIVVAMLAATEPGGDTEPIPPPAGSTSIPECDRLRGLAKRVDGCTSIPAEIKKTLEQGAANNLNGLEGTLPANYIEYVRPKCAMTGDDLAEMIGKYGCP